jgi:hypothetical protein
MLKRLAPADELIVVDRFLLPRSAADSVDNVMSLLEPVVDDLGRLVLVTAERHDERQFRTLRNRVRGRSHNCDVVLRLSDDFHDRFWIADRDRGLFVGTSPNGLGVRYALADYLESGDVIEVVEALRREHLL